MRRTAVLAAVLYISAAAVVCGSDFEQRISEKHWIRDYYNEVIYHKDRNIIVEYKTYYKEQPFWSDYFFDEKIFWFEKEEIVLADIDAVTYKPSYDGAYPVRLYIGHKGFDCRINKLDSDVYEIQIAVVRMSPGHYEILLKDGHDMRFARDAAEPEYSLYFQFDGEYLYIYLEDYHGLPFPYMRTGAASMIRQKPKQ